MFNRVTPPKKKPEKAKMTHKTLPIETTKVTDDEKEMQANGFHLPMALSVERLAEQLSISQKTAYWLVHQPEFPSIKLKGRYIVNTERLQDWLNQQSGLM